jgi:hypothetical protein
MASSDKSSGLKNFKKDPSNMSFDLNSRFRFHLILTTVLAFGTIASASATETISLRERVDGQRVVRTSCTMTAEGLYFLDPPIDPKSTKPMKLVGTLNINTWMGIEKVQMIIEDVLI